MGPILPRDKATKDYNDRKELEGEEVEGEEVKGEEGDKIGGRKKISVRRMKVIQLLIGYTIIVMKQLELTLKRIRLIAKVNLLIRMSWILRYNLWEHTLMNTGDL